MGSLLTLAKEVSLAVAERIQVSARGVGVRETLALRKFAVIGFFIFLSLGGSLVRLPLPTGAVAFETFPGYLAALTLGGLAGAIVAGVSHLLVAATSGFPLGIWLHLFAGLQMAVWAVLFRYIAQKTGFIPAIAAVTFLHALISVVYTLPIWNMAMFSGLFLPLAIAAAVNLLVAVFVFRLVLQNK
jgi:uncharacterized membrane protein